MIGLQLLGILTVDLHLNFIADMEIISSKQVKAESFTKQEFNTYLINCIKVFCEVGNHYTPQYLYIDKEVPINVLKFENLELEFHDLMKNINYLFLLIVIKMLTLKFLIYAI